MKEINDYFNDWLKIEDNRDVVIIAPEKDIALLPNDKDIKRLESHAKESVAKGEIQISPLTNDQFLSLNRFPSKPVDISYEEIHLSDTSIAILNLANGAKVILAGVGNISKFSLDEFQKNMGVSVVPYSEMYLFDEFNLQSSPDATILKEISLQDIQVAAHEYLTDRLLQKFILLPEK